MVLFPTVLSPPSSNNGVPEEKGNMKPSSERKVGGKQSVLKRRNKVVTT